MLNDLAYGHRHSTDGPTDAYGFPLAIHHRFALDLDELAFDLDGQRGDLQALGVDTALVSHPGYRRPGHDATNVGGGEWTELGARVLYGQPGGVQGFDFHSSTLLFGRYVRRYDDLGPDDVWRPDNVRGWGALVGLGTAFDYDTRDLAYGDDKVAGAGLVGPVVELRRERGREGIRFALSTYYSFAMVDSLAYAAYGDPLTSAAYQINTPLRQQGYYYGQGLSSVSSVVARLGDFELSLATSLAAYWSINFRDRYQQNLKGELSVSDTRANGASRRERAQALGRAGSASRRASSALRAHGRAGREVRGEPRDARRLRRRVRLLTPPARASRADPDSRRGTRKGRDARPAVPSFADAPCRPSRKACACPCSTADTVDSARLIPAAEREAPHPQACSGSRAARSSWGPMRIIPEEAPRAPGHRRRLLDRRDDGDERGVPALRPGDRPRHERGASAQRRRLSGREARAFVPASIVPERPSRRVSPLEPLRMVGVHPWRELAAPPRPGQLDRRPR